MCLSCNAEDMHQSLQAWGLCQERRMGRSLSHSLWFQRVRPENNLLFRLSAGGKQGMNVMKWVQGHGRLLLHLYLIPLVSLCDPCPGISCAAESCKAWGSWYLLLQAAAEGALFLPCSTLLPSCLCTGSHRSSSTWPQTWLLDGSENSANFTALLGTWHQVQGRAGPPFAGAVCSENR